MYFVQVVYFVTNGHVGFAGVMLWTKISPFVPILQCRYSSADTPVPILQCRYSSADTPVPILQCRYSSADTPVPCHENPQQCWLSTCHNPKHSPEVKQPSLQWELQIQLPVPCRWTHYPLCTDYHQNWTNLIIIMIIIYTVIMMINKNFFVIYRWVMTISMCGLVGSSGWRSFEWLLKKSSGGPQRMSLHLKISNCWAQSCKNLASSPSFSSSGHLLFYTDIARIGKYELCSQ